MESSIARQRGLGWFGLLFLFGTIAFFAIVVVKVGPLYMNHGTVVRVVKQIAKSEGNSDVSAIRMALQRRWDVDYIKQIEPKDIKVIRSKTGRSLAYDYEARVNLFYNVYVVVHFKDEHPMTGSSSDL